MANLIPTNYVRTNLPPTLGVLYTLTNGTAEIKEVEVTNASGGFPATVWVGIRPRGTPHVVWVIPGIVVRSPGSYKWGGWRVLSAAGDAIVGYATGAPAGVDINGMVLS